MDGVETFYALQLAFQKLFHNLKMKQYKSSIIEGAIIGAVSGGFSAVFYPETSSDFRWWVAFLVLFGLLTIIFKMYVHFFRNK